MRGSDLGEAMASVVDRIVSVREGTGTLDRPVRWEGRHELFGGLPSRDGNERHFGRKVTDWIPSSDNVGHPRRGARGTGLEPDLGRV